MQQRGFLFAVLLLGLSCLAFTLLYLDMVPLPAPLRGFFRGHRLLSEQVMALSGEEGPVQEAGRQILKPLGGVTLIRAIETSAPFAHKPAPAEASESSNTPPPDPAQ